VSENIYLDSMIQRAPNIVVAEIENDFMMMNVDRGLYYALTRVSARIWDLLESPKSVKEICVTLGREYSVDETICETEVKTFINHLVKAGLASSGV